MTEEFMTDYMVYMSKEKQREQKQLKKDKKAKELGMKSETSSFRRDEPVFVQSEDDSDDE